MQREQVEELKEDLEREGAMVSGLRNSMKDHHELLADLSGECRSCHFSLVQIS